MRVLVLSLLTLMGPALAPAAFHETEAPRPALATLPVLADVVVLGASVSAGFGSELALEIEGRERVLPVSLVDALVATVPALERARTHADAFFFTGPVEHGAQLVRQARATPPSCVIAVDFLFWYAYGGRGDLAARLRLLDEGLAQLEGFDCPLFVGDLPDVRSAPGLRAMAAHLPDDEQLEALQERVLAWLGADPRRHRIELARLVASSQGERVLEIGGVSWRAQERAGFTADDGLHPTGAGIVPLARLIAWALVEAEVGLEGGSLRSPEQARERLLALVRERADAPARAPGAPARAPGETARAPGESVGSR